MKFTTPKKPFVEALSRAIGYIGDGKASQIERHVLLTLRDKRLELRATDRYLSLVTAVDAEGTPGSVALPAKDLLERVKALPSGDIVIDIVAHTATIKAAGSPRHFTLHVLPAEDFPATLSIGERAKTLALPAATLRSLIDAVRFAISTDETRAHVNSMLLDFGNGTAASVATDGHRLSKFSLPCPSALGEVLIPLKAVDRLRKLLDGAGDDAALSMRVDGTRLSVELGSDLFVCALTQHQFPPYKQVIPKQQEYSALVPRLALRDAVSAVQIAASDRTNGVHLRFERDILRVTAESADQGNASDEVPCEYSGSDFVVGLNGRYIVDALDALSAEQVRISHQGELDPVKVLPDGEADHVIVLMPMRI